MSDQSQSTASEKIDKLLYQEIMRERCEAQGHSHSSVIVWGGNWQHPTRRSWHECEWCGDVR